MSKRISLMINNETDSKSNNSIKTINTSVILTKAERRRSLLVNSFNSMQPIFKENFPKLAAYLTNQQQQDQSQNKKQNLLNFFSLINLQNYKTLDDGIYILIKGTIKMITFSNEEQMGNKLTQKQIMQNVFRKLRTEKEKQKQKQKEKLKQKEEIGNGNTNANTKSNKNHLNFHNNIISTIFNSMHSQIKNLQPQQQVLPYNVSKLSNPFTLFNASNQNCMSFQSDTLVYLLSQYQLKKYQFYQNQEFINKKILAFNRNIIKNHSKMYHTIESRKVVFRNFIDIQNVGYIKKGTIKVWDKLRYHEKIMQTILGDQYLHYQKQKQDLNSFRNSFSNESVQFNSKSSRKLICQLPQGSILLSGFQYEINSVNAQILLINQNETFKLLENPQWIKKYIQSIKQNFIMIRDGKYQNINNKKNEINTQRNQRNYNQDINKLNEKKQKHHNNSSVNLTTSSQCPKKFSKSNVMYNGMNPKKKNNNPSKDSLSFLNKTGGNNHDEQVLKYEQEQINLKITQIFESFRKKYNKESSNQFQSFHFGSQMKQKQKYPRNLYPNIKNKNILKEKNIKNKDLTLQHRDKIKKVKITDRKNDNKQIQYSQVMNELNQKNKEQHKLIDCIISHQTNTSLSSSSNNGFIPKNITKQAKQRLFFKIMSSYVIVSQKIGLKNMIATRQKLKQKDQNIILKMAQQSKSNLKIKQLAYQTQKWFEKDNKKCGGEIKVFGKIAKIAKKDYKQDQSIEGGNNSCKTSFYRDSLEQNKQKQKLNPQNHKKNHNLNSLIGFLSSQNQQKFIQKLKFNQIQSKNSKNRHLTRKSSNFYIHRNNNSLMGNMSINTNVILINNLNTNTQYTTNNKQNLKLPLCIKRNQLVYEEELYKQRKFQKQNQINNKQNMI